ncbi:MAG: hypothetical protein JXR91_13760, partial [Deltaproteobacteria bacterium]|nr:hypothetical protein [Deltaproteobacteria bacterium]
MSENILIWVSLLIVLSNLYIISSSRLSYMIKGIAVQGFLLSLLPILLLSTDEMFHMIFLAVLGVAIKGIIIPSYLYKTIRNIKVQRDASPVVGYTFSIFFGLFATMFSFYIINKIEPYFSSLSS